MKKIILWIVLILVLGVFNVYGDDSTKSPALQITLLNQEPNPGKAGDTVDLRFKITNTGGEAVKKLNVELVQDYPFSVASGDVLKILDNIDAYQTANNYLYAEYKVKVDKEAVEGLHELKIRYGPGNNIWTTVIFYINVKSRQFAQIIYIDKAKLEPGKETEMKFTINNVGNAPLQNIVFSWQEPNGVILPVYSGDAKYIKYLDVGESIDLTYNVIADVNAKPGLYKLDLSLKDSGNTTTTQTIVSTKAGVFIGGETDFDVAFSESSQGQTSLSVANTGNTPAQSVSVMIPQQDSFRVTGSNSAIIGNLDKGDYTLVSFQISKPTANQTRQNAQGNRPANGNSNTPNTNLNRSLSRTGNDNLQVIIEYTDTTGERRSVEKSVPINFRASGQTQGQKNGAASSSSFIGSTNFWLVVFAGFVVCVIIFRRKIGKILAK